MSELKKKILEEMTVDHHNALEKNFELAKQLIRITKDGKVDVLYKEKLSGKDQIMLYLIGKLYAKEAELAESDEVGNKELLEELGIPEGSLLPWLKELRDKNKIQQIKRGRHSFHKIPINLVEKTLKEIKKKLNKKLSEG